MLARALRNMTQRGNRSRYANLEFGAIASGLGLTMVAGDPAFNLAIDLGGRHNDVASDRRHARHASEALDLCASGDVDGRCVELVWRDGASKRRGLLSSTITYSYDGRLSVAVSSAVPPFEVVNRKPQFSGAMVPAPVLGGPARSLGTPADERFLLTASGDVPSNVIDVVAAQLRAEWEHYLWDGESLSWVLAPFSAMVLGERAHDLLQSLRAIAAALEAAAGE